MTEYLFNTPWWLPTLIAGVGLFVAWQGNRRQERRVMTAGLGIVGVAAVLVLVSWLVETDIEKTSRQSRQVVQAFLDGDWATMRSLMDTQANLQLAGVTLYDDREQILTAAKAVHERDKFRSLTVYSLDPAQTGSFVNVQLKIISMQETLGRPLNSTWQFEWRKGAGGEWALTEITSIGVQGLDAGQLRQFMPRAENR